jgi:hypothetical protein
MPDTAREAGGADGRTILWERTRYEFDAPVKFMGAEGRVQPGRGQFESGIEKSRCPISVNASTVDGDADRVEVSQM